MRKTIAIVAIVTIGVLFGAAPAMGTEVPEPTVTAQAPDPAPEVTEDAPAADPVAPVAKTSKTKQDQPDTFEAYEVEACWQMSTSDGVEGTYEWPQTRVFAEDCGAVPACAETVEFQHDTYWIRDEEDNQYLEQLTTLNSPADDARLDPHNYYSEVVHGAECVTVAPPTITQPTCDNPDYKVNWVSSGPNWTGEIIYPPNSSAPNVINVMAMVDDGYDFNGESYWELVIQPLDKDDCNSPSSGPSSSDVAVLPDTGAGTDVLLVGLALLTVAGGVALVRAGAHQTV